MKKKNLFRGIILTALLILLVIYVCLKDRITVICVGDSITMGAGVYKTRDRESYPAYLQKYLGDDYRVINCGRSGTTTQHDGDHPYIASQEYEISRSIRGDVYIIMLGTNDTKPQNWRGDSLQNYEEDLTQLVTEYIRIAGAENVYLLQPVRCFEKPDTGEILYGIDDEIVKGDLHDAVARVGDNLGVHVIDMYEMSCDHPEYYVDGIHPGADGNRIIAGYLYEAIWD